MKAENLKIAPVAGVLIFFLAGLQHPTHAQEVHGKLLDRSTGAGVEGALVLLLNTDGETEGGSLTFRDGRFLIRAPDFGRFLLTAYRIGYETTTSELFDLLEGDVQDIHLETEISPIELSELRVEAESRCVVRPQEGLGLARVWEEARKALTTQEWVEGENLLRFQATRFRRELDPEGSLILSETTEVMEGVSSNPVRSLPAEDLVEQGFVRPVDDDRFDYFGADAAVLLSDPFLDTHCLRFRNSPESPDLIGLAFEPVRADRPPDIEGTLWLDRNTARLRFLEFTYDWAPWEAATDVAGGRVEFLELPNGAWTIPRWWIRMPTLHVQYLAENEGQPTSSLLGVLEVGWEVEQVSTLTGQVVAPRALGAVRGLVRDETSHRPLAGEHVGLSGLRHGTVTELDGSFAMEGVEEGGHAVFVRTPFLDSLGVFPRGRELYVRGGEATEVQLDFPSRERILGALCGTTQGESAPTVLVGTVRAAGTGQPTPDAEVTVAWGDQSFSFLRQTGGLVEVTTDDEGRYRACVASPESPIEVQATSHGDKSNVERIEVPPGGIIVLDLWTWTR